MATSCVESVALQQKRDKRIYLLATILENLWLDLQFSGGYQPTVGVDYGFKIQNVKGHECKYDQVWRSIMYMFCYFIVGEYWKMHVFQISFFRYISKFNLYWRTINAWNDARRNVIWANRMTVSFVYHWLRTLATGFPAILSGIGRHFKHSIDRSNMSRNIMYQF